jgi:tRNA threonylcarbamoyladenosine dehydratase
MCILFPEKEIFQRVALLVGQEKMAHLTRKKAIIFGVGGVGSWCAESLVRSGIRHLTLVDSDRVCLSNINRQVQATTRTVGQIKTEALKNRLLEINPSADILALHQTYDQDSHAQFELNRYDYILDAIDSIQNKMHLIRTATRTKAVFFSAMGASLKTDPTQIRVAEFWKVKRCPLGARIRKLMRKGMLPAKEFLCVYSEELPENQGRELSDPKDNCLGSISENVLDHPESANHGWDSRKALINGTLVHITAIFGFTLAGLVIQDIISQDS